MADSPAYNPPMVEPAGHTVAGTPLLETKLYTPKWRPKSVSRPRLVERLDRGTERKLTLVSAPAGFGKTTLLAEWLAAGNRSAAWVSLDQSDNDPARFWAYFIASLQTMRPGLGESARSLLHSPQPPAIESVLTALINEVSTVEDNFALILDDYHVIDAQPVNSAVSFLLEHLPPQVHLIVASRSDPPLPLARLRGRGESTELRAADLRFTPDEAAAFLNGMVGQDLTAGDVAALETRTEGWIAGLQLAALSMQGREDISGFIGAFAGDDRYVVDYLVEEVLERQPESVRSFLLQTSILDRLSGPLCDAVTDQEEGKVLLEALERDNLFVVPLDDKRHWYRYHHLFADVLRAHAVEEQPARLAVLHCRASEWHENNGLPDDAIRHALAGEDFQRASRLVELAWPASQRSFEAATWFSWVQALPDDMVRASPVLSVGYGFSLMFSNQLEAAQDRLRDAELWLDTAADMGGRPAGMVVVDENEFLSLPARIALGHAFLAQAAGDVEGTERYAKRTLELLPEDQHFERSMPEGILALAYWAKGDLDTAHRFIGDPIAKMRAIGNIHIAIGGASVTADIRITQGRLNDAMSTYERSLQVVEENGEPVPRGTADLYLGLSELHLERGDLEAATENLLRSKEMGEQAAQEIYQYRSRVARARMKEVQGDLEGALELLDEAEGVYTGGVVPNVRPVAALKARLWVVQGRLTEALAWANQQGLSADDDLSFLREFEHVTLARILLAKYRSDKTDPCIHEANGLLERLLKAGEAGGRTGSVIEILLLQALAAEAQGDIPAALDPLERALGLAGPEDYVQIFLDEGESMRNLLPGAQQTASRAPTPSGCCLCSNSHPVVSPPRSKLPLPAWPSHSRLGKSRSCVSSRPE